MSKIYLKGRAKRDLKIAKRIKAGERKLRLSVFRSTRYIYAQIIDDEKRKTLISVSDKEVKLPSEKKITKIERAGLAGGLLGERAVAAKIGKVVFDRNGYKYHGRIKALAEGARKGGLDF
jgi:large subunit ribosomal protein L18